MCFILHFLPEKMGTDLLKEYLGFSGVGFLASKLRKQGYSNSWSYCYPLHNYFISFNVTYMQATPKHVPVTIQMLHTLIEWIINQKTLIVAFTNKNMIRDIDKAIVECMKGAKKCYSYSDNEKLICPGRVWACSGEQFNY